MRGIVCFSLSALFLISSCKKTDPVTDATNSQLAIANSQSNSAPKDLLTSKQSSLFAYLNTLPYDKALDTLKRYISAQRFKTNLSGVTLSGNAQNKVANVMSIDPGNATPKQMLTYSSSFATSEINANDGQPFMEKTIEKSEDWIVIQHFLNWWRVVGTDVLMIELGPAFPIGSYSPYFKGFVHAGSRLQTELPFNPVNWNENLNEHFPNQFNTEGPSQFDKGVQRVIAHDAGTISTLGLSANAEGFHLFHVTDFSPF